MRINAEKERLMETTGIGTEATEAEALMQDREAGGRFPGTGALAAERPTWARMAWWTLALVVVSAAALIMYAYPAFAQAGGESIDTCSATGGVGGEGGQKIINGIRNIALFGAALIGGSAVLGLLACGLMIILGSASKDWQRRGFTGLALCGIGIFIALGAASVYGIISWAICG